MGKQCKFCGAEITAPRRIYCDETCRSRYFNKQKQFENYRLLEEQRKIREVAEAEETKRKRRKPKNEEIKPKAVLKNKEVCKGCKYLFKGQTELKNTCNYLEMTGHSRIVIERANGGVKSDSCCCYERK